MIRALLLIIIVHFFCFASFARDIKSKSRAGNYLTAGIDHFRSDQYDKAISNLQAALCELSGKSGENHPERLRCLAYLANAYWNDCNVTKSGEIIDRCESEIKNIGNPLDTSLAEVYLLMAEYYLYAEYSFSLSDKCLDRASRILDSAFPGDTRFSGLLCFLKGYSNYLKKDFENALYYMKQSVELVRSVPSLVRYEFLNYRYLTYIYFDIEKDKKNALEFRNEVLGKKEVPDQTAAVLYYLRGWTHMSLKDTTDALANFQKAVTRASLQNATINYSTLFSTYYLLARLYKKDSELQLAYLNKALDMAQRISPTDKDVLFMYNEIALYYYRERNYIKTLDYLQNALIAGSYAFNDTSILENPSFNTIRQYHSLIEILSLKANALVRINTENLKYVESALQCVEIAAEMLNRHLREVDVENSELDLAESRKKVLNNAVTYAIHLYNKTGKEEYASKAFHYSETSKMQILFINTEKRDVLKKSGIPDSLIRLSERLGNEILEHENKIALNSMSNNEQANRYLTERLTFLYNRRDRLTYDFIDNHPEYRNSMYDMNTPAIKDIQSTLNPGQAMIEYQMNLKQLAIFVITTEGFFIHDQLIGKETRKHIENVRRLISVNPALSDFDSAFTGFVNSSAYLYNLLIRPVYEEIKGKRLIIIPHNELSQIPFEVLISDRQDGRPDYRRLPWLINEFPVIYAFSGNFLFPVTAEKSGRGSAVFAPGYNNNKAGGPDALEGTLDEALFLKKISRCRIFYGNDADEYKFKQVSPGYRILHIASHTLKDEKNPDLSCFILHKPSDSPDDGILHAFEIKQLRLNAQLVVLSGCNTGFGKLRLNEGLISLARSFFYAGIRNVAYTLWPVADNSSSLIIKNFYRQLKLRRTLDIALMKSKKDFIDSADPVKAHPYYWAGFVITGRAQNVPLNRFSGPLKILVITILASIAVFLAYRKISE